MLYKRLNVLFTQADLWGARPPPPTMAKTGAKEITFTSDVNTFNDFLTSPLGWQSHALRKVKSWISQCVYAMSIGEKSSAIQPEPPTPITNALLSDNWCSRHHDITENEFKAFES